MYPVRPIFPDPSPPFHHTSFPESPAPPRKLQAVRFSMLTWSAFHTTIPLRPWALPPTTGPKFWYCGSELHGRGRPGLGPVHDDAVAVHAPDGQVRRVHHDAAVVARAEQGGRGHVGVVALVVVAGGDQDVVARLCRIHRRLDRRVLPGLSVVGADEEHGGRAAPRRARGQDRSGQEGGAGGGQPSRHAGPTCHGCLPPVRSSSRAQHPFGPPGEPTPPARPGASCTAGASIKRPLDFHTDRKVSR